jgi:glycosyltransferase involved in cell wall biosynthesis
VPAIHLGPLAAEQQVAEVVAAADAMAVPSRSESFSLTVLEAQACGTVPVAFAIGGITDLIQHRSTGWLAEPFDVADFSAGLQWACERSPADLQCLAAAAQASSSARIAMQYVSQYQAAHSTQAAQTFAAKRDPALGGTP